MFNMRSVWDTTHVNSVCAFACTLQLWPEWVVACRVSLSSVSSGCAKLLLVECGLPDLFFVAISLGIARFFTNPLDLLFWCFCSSRSLSPAQTTFLFEFFVPCPNLHCCWRLFWELPHKCMLHCLVQLWLSILQHTEHHFSSSQGHLYICKDENFKH